MSRTRLVVRALIAVVLFIALAAPSVIAQNVDAMAKWTALTVIHYKVVGVYSAAAPVLSKGGLVRTAQVTDRVEMEFDWDQQEMKLVGKPVIKNFPSTTGVIAPIAACPSARVDGTLEHATVLGLSDANMMRMSGVLEMSVKRDQPAGSICIVAEDGRPTWEPAPAKSETKTETFTVAVAMALAMPGMIPSTPDGKSLVMKGNGWTWTQTPTPVR